MNTKSFSRIEPLEARIAPASFVWDGSVSNDWFTAANWSPDGVPGAADTAVLNNSSLTINLPSPAAVAMFQESAGTLTGPGTLDVLTSLDWGGGTMAGTGITKVAAGATLSISGAAIKTLNARTLSNAGTATWSAGMLDFSNGATFLNSGSFIAQSDSTIRSISGSTSFTNKAGGTFTNNTGTTGVEVAFANAGTLVVPSGALNFVGSFTQSAGTTHVMGGTLTASSILNFAGGELAGTGTVIGNVSNTGAKVRPGDNGAGVLTIAGNYTQGSGGMLNVEIGGTTPGTQHDQLSISGTATLGGTLAVTLINNFPPATGNVFNVVVAGTRSGTFSNVTGEGLLTANYTPTQAQLINNATTFIWDGSAGDGNWFTAANWTPAGVPGSADAAVLNINSTINLPSSTSIGSFQQTIGTFTSPANVTFTVLEGVTWTGGTISGSGAINANGGLLMNGGQVFLDGRTLNLPAGQSATQSGNAQPFLQNGARFNNAGTFLAQNDNGLNNGGGAASLFSNSGTFTHDTATGDFYVSVPFANSGTVNVATGRLVLTGGGSAPITGDFNVSSGASLVFFSNFTLASSADVAGAGAVEFLSGTVAVGGSFAIPTVGVSGGTANFNVTPSGLQTLTISAGTASFNTAGPLALSTLTLSGGTLTGTPTINTSGLLSWTGGTISGSGAINANGGLLMNGGQVFLDGRTLNLPAGQSATQSGNAQPFLQNGARFNNAGTFLAQNDNGLNNGGGAASLFSNSGTFTHDTATGDFYVSVPFANSGTVNVATGSMTFAAGFTQSAAGTILGGNLVNFIGGMVSAGGSITANVSNSGAVLSPGESGAGELVIVGNYVQNSGGTFKVELAGAGAGQFDKLTISGTAALDGTLDLALLGGFVPASGQQFNVLSYDANTGSFTTLMGAPGFTESYQATGLTVGRAGVNYVWDAGGGADTSWFNRLNWGPDGIPNVGDSAALISSATITVSTPASVGSFTQSAGILNGVGTLTAGSFTWTGGTQSGSGTTVIPTGGSFDLSGPPLKILTQRTLNLAGDGVWTGSGNVQLGNGAVFNNGGNFEIQNDASIQVIVGGLQPRLTNSGTIHKSAGAGTTIFSGLRFENSGELLLTSGTLSITGAAASFTQFSGTTRLSGGSLAAVPTLNFAGGVLSGVGSISGSVSNTGANLQPGGVGAAGTLTITGNYTQSSGATLDAEIGGTAPGTQYDRLTAGGTAIVGGTLEVSFINGFAPATGEVFSVVSAAARTGAFSTVTRSLETSTNPPWTANEI